MLRVVTFKIDDSLLLLLDIYARKNRISRSEAIRRAIIKMLREDREFASKLEEIENAKKRGEKLPVDDEPSIVIVYA